MLNDIIKNRYSPRAFSEKKINKEVLVSLFEAARWSPSSMNEQPWRFIVAEKEDKETYDKMVSVLKDANKSWAGKAPVLILACAKLKVERNNQLNKYALYDVGQSVAYLTMQAFHLGLFARQMGGFNPDKAKEIFNLPDDFIAVTVIAVGYKGEVKELPLILQEKENAVRSRKPLNDLLFSGKFNISYSDVKEGSISNY